jgi:hypothetical protein
MPKPQREKEPRRGEDTITKQREARDERIQKICDEITAVMSSHRNLDEHGLRVTQIRASVPNASDEELCEALEHLLDRGQVFTTLEETISPTDALPTPPSTPSTVRNEESKKKKTVKRASRTKRD